MKILTMQEAAAYLRVSCDTMRKLLKSGYVVGVRLNKTGDWRVTQEAIDSYLVSFCEKTSKTCKSEQNQAVGA